MKMETEITVLVNTNYNELHDILLEKGFNIKEEYEINDTYMIDSSINLDNLSSLDVLKKCILVRDITNIKKALVYKYKEYDLNGDILKQGKVECPVDDISKAIDFMKSINYKELFTIYDKNIIYSNRDIELDVQLVNNKYIFIELESRNNEDISKLKEIINSLDLPIDKSNYFVKKAQIVFEEK